MLKPIFGMTGRQRLLGMAAVCVTGLLAALVSQHVFDMRPCPWCILQRVIFFAIALVCVLVAWGGRVVHRVGALLALVLSVLGTVASIYQNAVASKLASCDLTLADRIINALGVEALWPAMFQITASCAESHVEILGVPYELLTLALYPPLALAALTVLFRPMRVG